MKKIPFTQDQLNLLNTIGFAFDVSNEMTVDQRLKIIDKTTQYLQYYGIGSDDELNAVGVDCRNLLDFMADY